MADLLGEPTRPQHDRAPLLPRGVTVFEDLPVRALVLDALAPAVDAGALRVSAPHATAVLVIRDGAVAAAHLFTEHERHSGSWVQRQIGAWSDGVVSAERFDDVQLELTDALLHGGVLYEDLRLEWTDWGELLVDLERRGGAFVIELDTGAGRGVLCIAGGRRTLAYTDVDPAAGDAATLDGLALRGGRVRVRRMNPVPASRTSFSDKLDAVRPAASPAPPPVSTARELEIPPLDAETRQEAGPADGPSPIWSDPHMDGVTGNNATSDKRPGFATEVSIDELDAPVADEREDTRSMGVVLPEVPWVAPWDTHWAAAAPDEPSAENGNGRREQPEAHDLGGSASSAPTVGPVCVELQAIARRYLKMSSSRVEAALDDAAAQEMPVDHVLNDLRSISIRGVMPVTIETMLDEMAALARVRQE